MDTKALDTRVIVAVSIVMVALIAAVVVLGIRGVPASELMSLVNLLISGYILTQQRQTQATVDQVVKQTNGAQTTTQVIAAASNPTVDPERLRAVASALQATVPVPGPAGPAGPQGATGATGPAGTSYQNPYSEQAA